MRFFIWLLTTAFVFSYSMSDAQIIPALGCNDHGIRLQAEQIKQDFKTQGLEVYKDAMIEMESKQPYPIAVQLIKGTLYQMVYIGSKEAKRISLEIYDGDDKKIDERVLKNPAINNFIVYSFVPEKTDLYLVILTQSKGTQNICGSFSIMQPSAGKNKTTLPKHQPKPVTNPRYQPKGSK